MLVRIICVLMLASLAASSGVAAATINPEEWNVKASFSAPLDYSNTWYVVELPSRFTEIQGLRLINGENLEVPFALAKQSTSTRMKSSEKESVSARIVENTLVQYQGKEERAIVIDTEKEGQTYTGIKLEKTPDAKNFRKIAHVYVADTLYGASSPAWKELERKSVVYNYSDNKGFTLENLNISFSGVFSRYVKVQFENAPEASAAPFNVLNARMFIDGENTTGTTIADYASGKFAFPKPETISIETNQIATNTLLIENNAKVLNEFTFDVDDQAASFVADVEVLVSGDTSVWKTVATSTIYRVNGQTFSGEKLSVELSKSVVSPFVEIVIRDRSGMVLPISKTIQATLQQKAIVFQAEGMDVEGYALLSGNEQVATSTYISQNDLRKSGGIVPSELKLKDSAPKPILNVEENSYIVKLLIAGIAILGIYMLAKKRKKA